MSNNNNREERFEDIIRRITYGYSIILNDVRKVKETLLLPQLEKHLSDDFIFIYVDLENMKSKEEFFKRIVSRVIDVCGPHLDVSELRNTGFEAEDDAFWILFELVRQLNGQAVLILLLDGVDTTKIYIQEALQMLRGLHQESFGQIQLVIAGVIVYESPGAVSPWWNIFDNIDATPFVEENTKPVKSLIPKFVANIWHRNKDEKQL